MAKDRNLSVNAEKLMSTLGIVHVNRYLADRRDRVKHQQKENPLSLWRGDAASVKALTDYITLVTDKNSADHIPPKDRIAVFDMDGTLFCETDPTYFDFRLFQYRVTEDPDYKNIATELEKKLARGIEEYILTGVMVTGFEEAVGHGIAHAFSGMTVGEFEDYVRRFGNLPAPGYEGMTAGEAFFKPMIQVLELLRDNDFVIFICSGTDRQVVRELVGAELDMPPRQVLGTEEVIVARDQGVTDGTKYVYTEKDELILGGKIQNKNLKMNKVAAIAQEIGQQPVLCFGNGSGDFSMANYVTDDNRYKTRVFMILCDDLERENGNLEKAAEIAKHCGENGWIPVSMKDDWKTIYGEGVKKKNV